MPPVDATRGSTRRFYQEGGLAIVFFLLPPEEYHPLATYSSVVRKTPWMRGEFRVAWTTAAIRRSVELYVHSAHEQTSRSLVLRRVRSGRPSSEDIARGIAESNGACDEERWYHHSPQKAVTTAALRARNIFLFTAAKRFAYLRWSCLIDVRNSLLYQNSLRHSWEEQHYVAPGTRCTGYRGSADTPPISDNNLRLTMVLVKNTYKTPFWEPGDDLLPTTELCSTSISVAT